LPSRWWSTHFDVGPAYAPRTCDKCPLGGHRPDRGHRGKGATMAFRRKEHSGRPDDLSPERLATGNASHGRGHARRSGAPSVTLGRRDRLAHPVALAPAVCRLAYGNRLVLATASGPPGVASVGPLISRHRTGSRWHVRRAEAPRFWDPWPCTHPPSRSADSGVLRRVNAVIEPTT
jgi:hypothetical protein